MKLFRNNGVYVEVKDIEYLKLLPEEISREIPSVIEYGVVKFTSPNAIDFFKNKEEILDYDYVSNLDSKELNKEIKLRRNKLNSNKLSTNKKIKLMYQIDTLMSYQNDEKVKTLSR